MKSIISNIRNWNIFLKILLIVCITILEKIVFYNEKLALFRIYDYRTIRTIFVILLPIILAIFLKTNIFTGIFLFIINLFIEFILVFESS